MNHTNFLIVAIAGISALAFCSNAQAQQPSIADTPSWAKGLTGEADRYAQRCLGGNMRACNHLAVIYHGNHYRVAIDTTNPEFARQLYEMACAGNEYSGCSSLGNMLAKGDGGRINFQRALCFHQKACEGAGFRPDGSWIPHSCNMLGLAHEHGVGVLPNLDIAHLYYSQSCEGPHVWGCQNLAALNAKMKTNSIQQESKDFFDVPTSRSSDECSAPIS